MPTIKACALPDNSLLCVYRAIGAYTDCYVVDIPGDLSHESFVAAFYTTLLFRVERFILKCALSKHSTDDDAKQLAAGKVEIFSAWLVEKRTVNQLLMSDMKHRTRSWLMVEPLMDSGKTSTRLYFGSAVLPVKNAQTGENKMGGLFRALLGFHKLYSVLLLRSAATKLSKA